MPSNSLPHNFRQIIITTQRSSIKSVVDPSIHHQFRRPNPFPFHIRTIYHFNHPSKTTMPKTQFALRRSLEERRRLLQKHNSCRTNSMGAIVGGTTAEVAAVGCCLPFAVVDFTVLTMYKVPAGLFRNAMRRKRQRSLMMDRNGGGKRERSIGDELSMHPAVVAAAERFMMPEVDKDVLKLEDEMWERFSESGFLRGPSETKN
ncbi:hypothetical protein R6Q59_011571 [Mikania micrantha]